jgi:hypothetical protein
MLALECFSLNEILTFYFQAKFVVDQNLAGVMFYSLNAEDFTDHHCGLRYPLLDAIHKTLNNKINNNTFF